MILHIKRILVFNNCGIIMCDTRHVILHIKRILVFKNTYYYVEYRRDITYKTYCEAASLVTALPRPVLNC